MSLSRPRLRLRSSSSTDYVLPRLRTKFGERAFSHTGPTGPSAWSRLPEDIRAEPLGPISFAPLPTSPIVYQSVTNNRCAPLMWGGGAQEISEGAQQKKIRPAPSAGIVPPTCKFLPTPLGLGERCKLPQRGLGRSPNRNRIWCISHLTCGGNNFDDFPENELNKFSLNDEERGGTSCLNVSTALTSHAKCYQYSTLVPRSE